MTRSIIVLLAFSLVLGASGALGQARKAAPAGKSPTEKDPSIAVDVYMRDANKNELLLSTRIWPDYPDYNAVSLKQYFALMKDFEPTYKQDDQVAYTWSTKNRVTKCSIYLETFEAGAKGGTGAMVGCEANGVSSVPAVSVSNPQRPVSLSRDPKHLSDVMDLFKKQWERAKNSLTKQ